MTRPADYRVPLTQAAGHVYLSANSLRWNPATAGQGHTVALGPGVIASYQGHTIALIPPEPVAVDPDSTAVLASAPAPRVMTVAQVERELRRPARQDPHIYAALIAAHGFPIYEPPTAAVIDGECSWLPGHTEVTSHG